MGSDEDRNKILGGLDSVCGNSQISYVRTTTPEPNARIPTIIFIKSGGA